ncbi:MAG: tetratricopeptide repeat protein [Elusimicrobia bacterium]|nr:tetratricopeptide repeat protein [Elusimicrobiota bacterium]
MMEIKLIEDHDQALKLWRKRGLRGLPLVHVDAHIDFRVPSAERPFTAVSSARSVEELKRGLEASLAFLRYSADFSRQTDIGNYIYPALEEGIVSGVYWVVPGTGEELRRDRPLLEKILLSSLGSGVRPVFSGEGACCRFRGREFRVCTLDTLPRLGGALLDIDADFMTADSLRNAENTSVIGRRAVSCPPEKLFVSLKKSVRAPAMVTIAYSTNGGFTPMRFRHLADELAFLMSPRRFGERYRRSLSASRHFGAFLEKGGKDSYWKAAGLVSAYRGPDNSYGMLYLQTGRLKKAEMEFAKVLAADPENPQALSGLGHVAFRRHQLNAAINFLRKAAVLSARGRFKGIRADALQVLGQACLESGRLAEAAMVFSILLGAEPLRPHAYYYAGETAKRQRRWAFALSCYRAALQLGLASRSIEASMRACARHIRGAIINDGLFRRGKA